MSDTLITIIAIFLAAVLMFVFPLMAVSSNQEDVSQLAVTEATQEFVNKAATKGKITQEDYDAYVQTLGATGNTYDIKIEVQHLDENPGKKVTTTSGDMIGENVRYSTFTEEILKGVEENNGKYVLSKGDNVIVTAYNTSPTLAETLRNFVYKTGSDTYQIGASASALVIYNGK